MTANRPYTIISFYKFFGLAADAVAAFEAALMKMPEEFSGLRGLTILGVEGMNSTFSVPSDAAENFRVRIVNLLAEFGAQGDVSFKNSYAEKHVFREFTVKVRDEIVTLERPDLVPTGPNRHLSPEDWHRTMSEENPVVIDTRNSYEYDIGHFKGAIDPRTEEFNEFPKWVRENPLPKDRKILIYCTGGIRCEKAILEMIEQGYDNVYQLDGGILNYLEKFPDGHFEGDCFVFDYRIAVDQNLQPSAKYKLCPHCGQPAKTKIDCAQCSISAVVCDACLEIGEKKAALQAQATQLKIQNMQAFRLPKTTVKNTLRTCSKNCAHHARLGHVTKRIHKDAFNRHTT